MEEGWADPGLTEFGHHQARRLPGALADVRVARVVASPMRRAVETAAPLVASTGLALEVNDGFAEYDRHEGSYVPIHEAKQRMPEAFARIRAGFLPDFVDENSFRSRVLDATEEVVAQASHEDSVVVVAHGGVVNLILQQILELPRPLTFPLEYVSVTRVLISRNGVRRVSSVNETGHVRDLMIR